MSFQPPKSAVAVSPINVPVEKNETFREKLWRSAEETLWVIEDLRFPAWQQWQMLVSVLVLEVFLINQLGYWVLDDSVLALRNFVVELAAKGKTTPAVAAEISHWDGKAIALMPVPEEELLPFWPTTNPTVVEKTELPVKKAPAKKQVKVVAKQNHTTQTITFAPGPIHTPAPAKNPPPKKGIFKKIFGKK